VTEPSEHLAQTSASAGALTFHNGSEVAGVAEALYLRLFVIALGCLAFVCGLAIVVALARTHNANFVRTAALALAMGLLAWLALQAPGRSYRMLRRRPALSLTAPLLALVALAIDGVLYSPLSYPATVSIAFPAFVCGRRWAPRHAYAFSCATPISTTPKRPSRSAWCPTPSRARSRTTSPMRSASLQRVPGASRAAARAP